MKKLLLVSAGLIIGVTVFAAGVVCLIYLGSSNSVTVDVRNDSQVVLHNVTVFLRDLPNSGRPSDLSPGQSVASGMDSRMKLAFRVVFDASGQHYDIPAQVRLLPFGSYTLFITIDDHMQVSIRTAYFVWA